MILYERQLVLGKPCKSLVPSHPWKLLMPGILGHPWKWLTFLYHGNSQKWVQGIVPGVALAKVLLTWVGVILFWDGLMDMPQLFYILQVVHIHLQ